MTNMVRGAYDGYSFDLIYKDKRLSSARGWHACCSRPQSGELKLQREKPNEDFRVHCKSCGSNLWLDAVLNDLPPPGKYQDGIDLTHACMKCGATMMFHELLDAEHNLCGKCKTKK